MGNLRTEALGELFVDEIETLNRTIKYISRKNNHLQDYVMIERTSSR